MEISKERGSVLSQGNPGSTFFFYSDQWGNQRDTALAVRERIEHPESLLRYVFPKLEQTLACFHWEEKTPRGQDSLHTEGADRRGRIADHIALVVEGVYRALKQLKSEGRSLSERERRLLIMAAYTLDLGMPETVVPSTSAMNSFPGHEQASVRIVRLMNLTRLGFDHGLTPPTVEELVWLIENHHFGDKLGKLSDQNVKEVATNPLFPLLFLLQSAIFYGTKGGPADKSDGGLAIRVRLYKIGLSHVADSLPILSLEDSR